MKLIHARKKHTAGNVLIMTLVMASCTGLVLAAYLNMIRTQNSLAARSQTWNASMSLVEAGLEEAIVHLNAQSGTNLAVNGWTKTLLQPIYTKSRTIGSGYFVATITASNIISPVVVCTGYSPAPANVAGSGTTMFAAAGGSITSTQYISRTVQLVLNREPLFLKALVTKDGIDLGGNSCVIDSYNSSIAPYDPKKPGDKGDVACNSDMKGAVSTGNADIRGTLHVGPNATVDIGPNAQVGDNAFFAAGKKGIQAGHLRRDSNFDLPDVKAPWTYGAGGAFPLGSADGNLGPGNYEINNMTLPSNKRLKVVGSGTAVIYVKGNVDIKGDIQINPQSTLILYVGGTKISYSGGIDKSDEPTEFMIYGLPSVKDIDTPGLAAVIYAPSANMVLNGKAEFFGATITKTLRMTGNTSYHYDEALKANPATRGYVITSWTEI